MPNPAATPPPEKAAAASALTPGTGAPPPPAAPPPLSWPAAWEWLKRAGEQFLSINGTLWSAAFAYYAFFALVPLAVFSLTLATGFVDKQRIFDFAFGNEKTSAYLPLDYQTRAAIRDTINSVFEGLKASRGSVGFVSLLGLFYSALGFFQALVGAVNAAWAQEQPSWWRLPLKNLNILLVLFSTFLLGNVLPTISKTVERFVSPLLGGVGSAAFSVANVFIPTILLFYGFLLFYKLAPRRRLNVTFRQVWLPALVVAVLIWLAQQVFVVYATNFGRFNALYGTFGGVIALMLWIYLTGIVIVFGACLCATRGQGDKEGTPAPDGGE